jgi:hypothetical protein
MSNGTTYVPRIYGVDPTQPSPLDNKYHYVYRITNLVENKHYYGSRTSTVHPYKDLGVRYFSSSKNKDFINEQKFNPSNYIYKVIRCYPTREEALQFEVNLHSKHSVGSNPNFYNRANQTSSGFSIHGTLNVHLKKDGVVIDRKAVPKEEVRLYTEQGWELGTGMKFQRSLGKKHIHFKNNDGVVVNRTQVYQDELPGYLEQGWCLGSGSSNKGTTVIHLVCDGTIQQKQVPVDQVESYLEQGWMPGKGVSSTAGRTCVHFVDQHGAVIDSKKVPAESLQDYLGKGWLLGSGRPTNLKKTRIHFVDQQGTQKKMVLDTELQEYLEQGWELGRGY